MQPSPFKPRYSADEEEDWMISFADMVTLLLCFFILFFSEKKDDAKVEADIIREITTVFSPIVPDQVANKSDQELNGSNNFKNNEEAQKKMMSNINKSLNTKLNSISGNNIDFELENVNSREILLRVWNEGMFRSGSANLSTQGRNLVMEVAKTLSKYSGKIEIRIEGHTDSINVRAGDKIRNNLVLSSLRAASTANIFLEDTDYFDESDLSVIGRGSKKLLADDKIEDKSLSLKNADKNRRIDLFIISKSEKIGEL